MTVTDYDAAIGTLVSGYPNALVDRGTEVDPSGMGTDFSLVYKLHQLHLFKMEQLGILLQEH